MEKDRLRFITMYGTNEMVHDLTRDFYIDIGNKNFKIIWNGEELLITDITKK